MKVPLKRVLDWHLCFDLEDMQGGKMSILQIMRVRESYQMPGKVIDRTLQTHQVAIEAGTASRKVHGVSLAIVIGREKKGKPLPAVPVEEGN